MVIFKLQSAFMTIESEVIFSLSIQAINLSAETIFTLMFLVNRECFKITKGFKKAISINC
jgi:hypothetical protein